MAELAEEKFLQLAEIDRELMEKEENNRRLLDEKYNKRPQSLYSTRSMSDMEQHLRKSNRSDTRYNYSEDNIGRRISVDDDDDKDRGGDGDVDDEKTKKKVRFESSSAPDRRGSQITQAAEASDDMKNLFASSIQRGTSSGTSGSHSRQSSFNNDSFSYPSENNSNNKKHADSSHPVSALMRSRSHVAAAAGGTPLIGSSTSLRSLDLNTEASEDNEVADSSKFYAKNLPFLSRLQATFSENNSAAANANGGQAFNSSSSRRFSYLNLNADEEGGASRSGTDIEISFFCLVNKYT